MEKEIVIRKVKTEDAEQFVNLNNYVWRIAYKDIFPEEVFIYREEKGKGKIKNFTDYYNNNNTKIAYVAENKGKIVGIMFGTMNSEYQHFAELGYADLMGLYIHPDYQGFKIASKFRNIFISWAKENGATKYVIGVLKENHNARKVYEKWGGKLDTYTQPFILLDKGYDEVFYTFNLEE